MIKNLILSAVFIFSGCQDEKAVNESQDILAKETYLVEVDKMPLPQGGIQTIQSNVVYPAEAKERNIQGKVTVQAFIDEEGSVKIVEVLKGADPLLDKAALDAVTKVKFTPGYKNGKAVKTQIIIPIMFKLNGDAKKGSVSDTKMDTTKVKKEGEYFTEADYMPEIIGGIKVITDKIVYPESEKKAGIQGDVLIALYIDEKGTVEKKEIVKGVNDALNKASLDALEGVKFTPGKMNGKEVKTKVTLPIKFKLQ